MRSVAHAIVITAVYASVASAQTNVHREQSPDSQPAPEDITVHGFLHDISRVEAWSFFAPPPSGGDPTYATFANRATLGVRVMTRKFDVEGVFQYSQLLGLSERSLGPGALGSGGLYYFSALAPEAFQLYLKGLNFRVKNIVPGLSVAAGRMGFSSGEENASGIEALDDLRRRRIGARLIGEFEWSVFQRAFDGVRIDLDRSRYAANASLILPTQGGYEESANPTISALKIMTASVDMKPALLPHHDVQVFGYHYRDQRDVQARPDNAIRGGGRVDVSIATVGASSVGSFRLGAGAADTVAWVAAQTGDWYGQDHRAWSLALEGGYRFDAAWHPWLRAGWLHASGDPDGTDNRHQTFFQMVPSIERYSKSTTYALMNLRDVFADLALQPHNRVSLRTEVHHLTLADPADRWYYGSGATSRRAPFFGFATHPSGGDTGLGTIIEGEANITLKRVWSVKTYVGWMKGGDVVRRSFVGDRLTFFYLENALRF